MAATSVSETETMNNSEQANNNDVLKEIAEVKSTFIGRCRVITDTTKHIITIQPENFDVTIKFQLSKIYPSVIPDITVRSSSLSQGNSLALRNSLIAKAKELTGAPMIHKLMKTAQEMLSDLGLKPGKVGQVDSHTVISDSKSKDKYNKHKSKKKRKPKSEDEVEEEKKKPMKTADDVIKRILWDESLDKDDFLVGYIDRFRGLLEKYFSSFSWEDLATVEYDALAVPRHRIQYFKYKTVKVWDKPHRIDNVFGSARGTKTIDIVIKELSESEGRNLDEGENGQRSEDQRSSSDFSDSESDSDEDDNIMVTIGASANIGTRQNNKVSADKSGAQQLNEEDNAEGSYNPYWRDKLRPNYFVCVRITDPTILDRIGDLQDHLLEKEPVFGECCVPGASLHVTLCTLGLDTPEQLLQCMDALKKMKDELKSLLPTSVLKFHGVSHFYNRVVYAKINYRDDFMDFCNALKLNLREAGIEIRDGYEFVPHMTIIKTTRPVSRLRGSKNIDPAMYKPFLETRFGEQKVDSICLCSMSSERREDGFYLTPTELSFN